jgi:S1-C subfamily serine protease
MLVTADVTMRARGRARRRGSLAALCGFALAASAADAGAASGRAPAEAMAFVRVVADVRIDFGGLKEPAEHKGVELATGSGFVVAPSGLILTSRHVIAVADPPAPEGGAFEAKVSVDDRRVEVVIGPGGSERTFVAWVAAADEETDLAALQVAASDLAYLPLGDSDAVEAGRAVQVLGFPFGRQVEVGRRTPDVAPAVTVAAGSLSAARENDEGQTRYLQTDATLNPGSSGGPMLDADGYVVGVVRMKLARDAESAGAGFAVPVNLVKAFLDAHGLLGQLPVGWLRPGVLHSLDWKRLRIEMPDGYLDSSPSRLRAEMGEVEGIQCRVDRVATALTTDELEPLLLRGEDLPGFAPGRLLRQERQPAAENQRQLALGSALLEGREGEPLRVEYAVYDLGGGSRGSREKVVARYLGAPDALAFNLGRIRRSLRSLSAEPMRLPAGRRALLAPRPAEAPFTTTALPQAQDVSLPVPGGWVVEPVEGWACEGVPEPRAGLAASPRDDYTLVLRARWWPGPAGIGARLGACGGTARRFLRFGSDTTVQGLVLGRGEETLLVELEAPTPELAAPAGVFEAWLGALAGAGFARR